MRQHILQRKFPASHQGGHPLRRLARHRGGEQPVGQQQSFDVGGDLGHQPLGFGFCRPAEEHRPELQPAAQGFFHDAHALNGAMAIGSEFAASEGATQLLDQGVVPSFEGMQSRRLVATMVSFLLVRFPAHLLEIIR